MYRIEFASGLMKITDTDIRKTYTASLLNTDDKMKTLYDVAAEVDKVQFFQGDKGNLYISFRYGSDKLSFELYDGNLYRFLPLAINVYDFGKFDFDEYGIHGGNPALLKNVIDSFGRPVADLITYDGNKTLEDLLAAPLTELGLNHNVERNIRMYFSSRLNGSILGDEITVKDVLLFLPSPLFLTGIKLKKAKWIADNFREAGIQFAKWEEALKEEFRKIHYEYSIDNPRQEKKVFKRDEILSHFIYAYHKATDNEKSVIVNLAAAVLEMDKVDVIALLTGESFPN